MPTLLTAFLLHRLTNLKAVAVAYISLLFRRPEKSIDGMKQPLKTFSLLAACIEVTWRLVPDQTGVPCLSCRARPWPLPSTR